MYLADMKIAGTHSDMKIASTHSEGMKPQLPSCGLGLLTQTLYATLHPTRQNQMASGASSGKWPQNPSGHLAGGGP